MTKSDPPRTLAPLSVLAPVRYSVPGPVFVRLPLERTPEIVAKSASLEGLSSTNTVRLPPARSMAFFSSVSWSAAIDPNMSADPSGTKLPLPQTSVVGLAVPPMATVILLLLAENPPLPVHWTVFVPLVPRLRVNVERLSSTPPARTRLLAEGSPLPQIRRTPPQIVVGPVKSFT